MFQDSHHHVVKIFKPLYFFDTNIRSSHQKCSIKQAVLKNLAIFTEIFTVLESLWIMWKWVYSPVNNAKFLKTPILKNFCELLTVFPFMHNETNKPIIVPSCSLVKWLQWYKSYLTFSAFWTMLCYCKHIWTCLSLFRIIINRCVPSRKEWNRFQVINIDIRKSFWSCMLTFNIFPWRYIIFRTLFSFFTINFEQVHPGWVSLY